ncbi:MAG TPA: TolC family protein [Opitutaceae bacterium]|nr:TolC family protein [Opitutaceae bacterium]
MMIPRPLLPALRRSTFSCAITLAGLLGAAIPGTAAPEPAPAAAPAPADASTPAAPAATPMSLDQAISLALQRNQRIKVSSYSPGIGRANVLAAYGQFDPALTFRRSYSESYLPSSNALLVNQLTKEDDYSLALEGATPWGLTYQLGGTATNQRGTSNFFTDNYLTFGGLTVTQPLLRGFGFGANLANLRIAKADRTISDWQYRQTVIDTVTTVIIAYDDLAEAREMLTIASRSRDLASQLVRDNEKRNRVGSISDADVTQARARAANREEQVLIARRGVHDLENRLRELTGEGRFIPDGPELAVEPLTPAPTVAVDGAADLRSALELRPDYQAARAGVTKLRANAALARNELLPRLDFVGSYGYNGLDPSFAASRAQVRNREHRAYSAGMVVSIPLTFAQGRGRARAAKLSLQQSQADLVRLEQDIALSVASAIGQLETTAQRVQATTHAYELAQQALDAEEKRFKAGTSSTFLVLQLQEQLAAVQASQVHAIADQWRALATYQHEIGTTLAVHHLKLQ